MGSKSIPVEEINFHPMSFCDRNARVFWWQGELYRGICPHKVNFYRDLFAKGVAQRAIEQKLLVATELTEWTLPDYPLILKHHPIPFVTYAHEWCPTMLKDCAWLVTKLMLELAKDDLTLADVSTFDIMFDGSQPVFVDFGSLDIADHDGDRSWIRYQADFRTYFIDPLKLMAQGHGKLARWLFMDYDHDVMVECAALMANRQSSQSWWQQWKKLTNWNKILNQARFQRLKAITSKFKKLSSTQRYGSDLVLQLWQEVEQIPLPNVLQSPNVTPPSAKSFKQNTVKQILSELKPATVLDLGCDRGDYSQLAAALGIQVVAIDRDETKITQCYQNAAKHHLPVFPVIMNIRDPSPGHGVCNRLVSSAFERLDCELVLALGLVHHLVFEQFVTLEQIAETLALFSRKWLLVEFFSEQDGEITTANLDNYGSYNLANFRNILHQWFTYIKTMPSDQESRILLLCQK